MTQNLINKPAYKLTNEFNIITYFIASVDLRLVSYFFPLWILELFWINLNSPYMDT